MAREHGNAHRVADFIPQSVVNARRYRMRIATFPAARFIEPSVPDQRALLVAVGNPPRYREVPLAAQIAYVVAGLAFVLGILCSVPFLIGP